MRAIARATLHLCAEPFCDQIVDGPGRWPRTPTRRESRQRRLRLQVREDQERLIAEHPYCQATLPNGMPCLEPAIDVHHVDHARPGDARFYDWTNPASRCRSCHRRDTEHEKRERRRRESSRP
jgi:hypothetical protein